MAKSNSTRPRRARASLRQHLEAQRRRLLGADAVIICCQRALDNQSGPPDELRVMDALQVASDIINASVAALDSVNMKGAVQRVAA